MGVYKRIEENNRKMSERLKGRTFTKEHVEKLRKANLGKKQSPEHTAKLAAIRRESFRGKGNPFYGKKHSPETRKKMSGKNHPAWKGGIYSVNKSIRKTPEYRLWRIAVFERDHYTCVWCGQRGGRLHPDHIKPFAYFPELRFAIDNGRTLCEPCHKKTDTYGAKAKRYAIR